MRLALFAVAWRRLVDRSHRGRPSRSSALTASSAFDAHVDVRGGRYCSATSSRAWGRFASTTRGGSGAHR